MKSLIKTNDSEAKITKLQSKVISKYGICLFFQVWQLTQHLCVGIFLGPHYFSLATTFCQ